MNKTLKYIAVLAVAMGSMALTSCNEDLAVPPYSIPENSQPGNGTWNNPMQCWQVKEGITIDGHVANWVTGYIVGFIDTGISNTVKGAVLLEDPQQASVASNVLIAEIPYNKEKWDELGMTAEDCVSVQLPSGSAVRSAINLSNNPGNLGRLVSLRGVTGQKYCGMFGIRQTGDYNWGERGRYEPETFDAGETYFCNFSISRDMNYYIEHGWKRSIIKGDLDQWTVRERGDRSYAYISAYYGNLTDGPYENWLVTPALNLDEAAAKTLSFATSCNGASVGTTLEAYVLTTQYPRGCEPVKLECNVAPVQPGGGQAPWTASGEIDLSEFSGVIYIGFRYYAEAGGSTNNTEYMVTDVNLGGANPEEWVVDDPTIKATYQLADTFNTEDIYLMVCNDHIVQPLAESYSYGAMTLGAEVDGDTVNSLTTYAFTFTEVEEGKYTIQDAFGRYIFLQGTYDTFNTNLILPETGGYWSVENVDGVFKITNLEMNKVISYSSRGDVRTVAASAYNGGGPRLYRRIASGADAE